MKDKSKMIKFIELRSCEIFVHETRCDPTIWTNGFHRDPTICIDFDAVHNAEGLST